MTSLPRWSSDNLPPWFERVAPVGDVQGSLFTDVLFAVLAVMRVSEDELGRWHNQGWVSFGADRQSSLEPHEVNEIRFVRDVVRSGMSDAYIAELLSQLPRPLNFSPDEVAYSFSLGWVRAGPVSEPDPNDIVDEYVEDWLESPRGEREPKPTRRTARPD